MPKPLIRASFILDKQGRPIAIQSGGTKHYRIKLHVEDVPEDAHAVTYELHESYYDPIREVRRDVPNFEEEITSYGDYDLKIRVRRKNRVDLATTTLGRALENAYKDSMTPMVREAIDEIKSD